MSKGSKRRPQQVSEKEFSRNWDRAFAPIQQNEKRCIAEAKKDAKASV